MSDPPLRVLQVGKYYPPYMGGIETHLENLCLNLKEWVDLRVVVAAGGRETVREDVDGVPVTRLGTKLRIAAAPLTPGLAREVRDSGADLVHVHLPHPTAVLSLLGSGYHGPVVATYHSDIVRQKAVGALYGPLRRKLLRRCAAIIATSPNYLASSPVLREHRERVTTIPYGIPLGLFSPPDSERVMGIRREHGDRLVISVGRLIYYKGFDVLIRAMAEVDGRLLIVGDGPLRDRLEALSRELGIADRITFLGEIQNRDVVPYYHASQLFALASVARSEAFGIVQLEAMACGRPVINTALDSGVPFVSLDGESGLTVPPRDPAALAAAIRRLLNDDELRARFGAAARERVEREFTVERMAAQTLDLYRKVTGGAAGTGRTEAESVSSGLGELA